MNPTLVDAFAYLVSSAAALIVIFQALRDPERRDLPRRWLAVYCASTLGWIALEALVHWNLTGGLVQDFAQRLPLYAVQVLALLFLGLTQVFLHDRPLRLWIWIVGGLWLALVLLLDSGFVTQLTGLARSFITLALLLTGWSLPLISALLLHLVAFRKTTNPLHRNRILHWLPVIVGITSGQGLVWQQFVTSQSSNAIGNLLHAAGCLGAAYILLTYHLPDIRQTNRRILRYLIGTLFSAVYVGAGFVVLAWLQSRQTQLSPWVLTLLALLTLSLGLKPTLDLLYRLVDRFLPVNVYDANRTLREYSQGINNILDLESLATVSIGLINEAFEIQSGHLFTVRGLENAAGQMIFRLDGVRGLGQLTPMPVELFADSPLPAFFATQRQPLTQYEIDVLPEFRPLTPHTRAWLADLAADVFVPIYRKGQWIGLLAIGPKVSGAPFAPEELNFLASLADQSSVALENASLVSGLTRLNNEFRRAHTAMEKVNRQLEDANRQLMHLDRTKSDFISITSHELRTPLTLIDGYAQLLRDDPDLLENSSVQELLTGIIGGAARMHDIISSMLDMALIDAQALEVRITTIDLAGQLKLVAKSFAGAMQERSLNLALQGLDDLPKIESDPNALTKAFYHLIVNAIKFTPDGGMITISASLLNTRQSPLSEPSIEVIIADTGIGIQREQLELIFTKFYQTGEVALHSSGKTKFKGGGPGLGLAIVRGIITALRGRIWAESPGYDEKTCPGARFHVVLPVKHHRPTDEQLASEVTQAAPPFVETEL